MLDQVLAWLPGGATGHGPLLLLAGYVVATAATMLIAIGIIAALPVTYFRDGTEGPPKRKEGAVGVVGRLAKNALGLVLIVLGLLLSLPAIPGQGVLTMLVGLILVDVPGKRSLERKLVARPRVLDTMNRLRAWLGRPPLVR
jgi:hypothetical protein